MKETGLTGKRRSTTIAATPDDGKSQRKRRRVISWMEWNACKDCMCAPGEGSRRRGRPCLGWLDGIKIETKKARV